VDVPLAAAWHVGDSLASDVAGARMAGLGAGVWLNRNDAGRPARQDADPATSADARPDYEITSLSELPALLADRSA
jgi:FMN phosphatase YigB (HAD superfamily)